LPASARADARQARALTPRGGRPGGIRETQRRWRRAARYVA